MELREYLKKDRHLPGFLKDFHDQKDFFKALWDWQHQDDKPDDKSAVYTEGHTWVSQHVFTIDTLLKFLACHGYRLEKIRQPKMEFYDLRGSIKECKDREFEMFSKMFEKEEKNDK